MSDEDTDVNVNRDTQESGANGGLCSYLCCHAQSQSWCHCLRDALGSVHLYRVCLWLHLQILTAGSACSEPGNPGCHWWAIQLCPQLDNPPPPSIISSQRNTVSTSNPGSLHLWQSRAWCSLCTRRNINTDSLYCFSSFLNNVGVCMKIFLLLHPGVKQIREPLN